jgi:hypothetical protein
VAITFKQEKNMVRQMGSTLALLLLVGMSGIASDDGDRQKLLGSWVLQGEAGSDMPSGWTFQRKGELFQITEMQSNNPVADYSCSVEGKECEVKTFGKKVKISMWFNGPKLVQMETQGSSVVKRRFAVLPQGDTMELEVIPIAPSGKTETLQFKREPLSAQTH